MEIVAWVVIADLNITKCNSNTAKTFKKIGYFPPACGGKASCLMQRSARLLISSSAECEVDLKTLTFSAVERI